MNLGGLVLLAVIIGVIFLITKLRNKGQNKK